MSNENTEQYRELINKLQRDEQRTIALNEIKKLLTFKSPPEVITTIMAEGISKIVKCLSDTDKNQVDLTCEVLKLCFEKFQVGDVVRTYVGNIMYLLRHDKDCVRRLAIDEVCKVVTTDPSLLPVPQYIDVFVAAAQLVSDMDVSVANKAIMITSNLPFEVYPKVLEEMKIALEYNTSSKCNAFEVIINISLKSFELFKLSVELGYVNFMVSELQSKDFLYHMNILELLSRLAVTPYGLNHLVKEGALKSIAEIVAGLDSNPLGGLFIPGYMKFFGCIAHNYPKEIFDKYPVLLDALFAAFDTKDQSILPVALDTLGFIGTTVEGKLCLAALGSKYIQTVEKLGQIVRNSSTEMKVRALYCFANIISIDKDPTVPKSGPVDHRVTLMTREWFRSLSEKPPSMETVFGLCKNPFPDIRLAAFTFLDALCQHQWGEELVARTAGFIEYLLDRSVDYTKESKEAKYDIIKRLSNSGAFDPAMITRLQTYVEQGPFYSESQMEVAMDDAD